MNDFQHAINTVIGELAPQPWEYTTPSGTTLTVIPAGLREEPGRAEVIVRITVDKTHAAEAGVTTTAMPGLIAALDTRTSWEHATTTSDAIAVHPDALGVALAVVEAHYEATPAGRSPRPFTSPRRSGCRWPPHCAAPPTWPAAGKPPPDPRPAGPASPAGPATSPRHGLHGRTPQTQAGARTTADNNPQKAGHMTQPQQPWQPAPQPPKQHTGRTIALGCAGAFLGGLLLLGGCAAIIGSSSDTDTSSGTSAPAAPAATDDQLADDQPADTPQDTPEPDTDATHDAITSALEITWEQQDADQQDLICSGWVTDPDSMLDAFMEGVGGQDTFSEDDVRAAAEDFLDDKCGV